LRGAVDKKPIKQARGCAEGRTGMAIEGRSDAAPSRKIKLGMVGGSEGAFIGAVHRLAARMDDHYEFVAGALSSTPEGAHFPGVEDGVKGLAFIEAAVESSKANGKRVKPAKA
jgi:hypothetical protein